MTTVQETVVILKCKTEGILQIVLGCEERVMDAHLSQLPPVEELDGHPEEENGVRLKHERDGLFDPAKCRMRGFREGGVDVTEVGIRPTGTCPLG